MISRRNIIGKAASVTGMGVVGTVGGSSKSAGMKEIGLSDSIESLIVNGEREKAQELLEENNVDYGFSKSTVGNDNAISPEWHYSKSSTDLTTWALNNGDGTWDVYGGVHFDEDGNEYSSGSPNKIADGCGIVFDHAEWSAPQPSEDGVEYFNVDYLEMEHSEYNPNYGPSAEVHHDFGNPQSANAHMKTTLTKADSGNDDIPVQFAYEHTYSWTGLTGDVSVSIAYGALKVTLPLGGNTAWKDEVVTNA